MPKVEQESNFPVLNGILKFPNMLRVRMDYPGKLTGLKTEDLKYLEPIELEEHSPH